MAGKEPINSGVEAMAHRSAGTSAIIVWAMSTSFIFINPFRFGKPIAVSIWTISGGHYATALI
jgi:hypothetical protein